ncbi:MAG: TonB family protein [Candidatus Zixiibacteriota bacterium]|nr:MAG: TonB family protein [candidate division Zixibacteria bacterium]
MMKSAILAAFVLATCAYSLPVLGQRDESGTIPRFGGRYWTISDLDTLSTHRWVWRDPSFRKDIPQIPGIAPDEMPRLKKHVAVDYPSKARLHQAEADLLMRVLIDKKGKVRTAYVLMDSGNDNLGFEEAALEMARNNRWEPARRSDEPMDIWLTYRERFRLMATAAGDPITKVGKWDWRVIAEEPLTQLTAESEPVAESIPDSADIPAGEIMPAPIKLPPPVYPAKAVLERVQGSVSVKVLVDKRGKVRRATIITPSDRPGYGFEESALRAALEGKWNPAMEDGKPIAVWVSYPITYLLKAPK